ncbi:type II toxin-antitoxin system YafQ family toxin [Adlercreutzia sp. ZJ154]|uniref:type II toxin-antitoxin system RelE/ParE family toxin n=1 Tax=Adlercreutzia sp. ZJ154 TaxID=2709790 RepID=UPI0013E9FDAB|nr:type II toxin-antitoxin system YafQ family toxin [Adlercreutzia sp. ZJ154]
MLHPNFTPRFNRDVKRLSKKHIDFAPLDEVMKLIVDNTEATNRVLRQRHNKHLLKGEWEGSYECHVANARDWLLIWMETDELAVFERTGTHDDLFD